MKYFVNKTVLRKDKKSGGFSYVQNSIMYDKRLTPTAILIIMSILNDSDTFNVTQELIMGRFGFGVKRVRNAFKNLEKNGYLRRTDLPRGHHYIISEYGNLNTSVEIEQIKNNKTNKMEKEKKAMEINNVDELNEYLIELGDFICIDKFNAKFTEVLSNHNNGSYTNMKSLKAEIKPILNRYKTKYYKDILLVTEKKSFDYTNKAIEVFKAWLKEQVFNKSIMVETKEASNKWLHFQMQNKKPFITDHETMVQDAISEAIADGDYDC